MNTSVAVLMGGPSSERGVSLQSGKAIQLSCEYLGYNTIPVVFDDDIIQYLDTLLNVDLVLIALHGGIGENGRIQGMLESLGIRYTGSNALSSAMCMDKHISKLLAEDMEILTPGWKRIREGEPINRSQIKFPCVVKPNSEGSTIGLTIVKYENQLEEAIDTAFDYDTEILIEDYIKGKELTVSVVDDDTLPIIEIRPSHGLYDFECKYTKGMTEYICPAELDDKLSDKIHETTLKIYNLLKCRHYGRVDFRLDENNKYWFLEVNTLPGMTETSLVPKAAKAVGMTFDQLVQKIINQALN
ncbi:MAG TPA: D-alanine--D-alanine ligase [Candidatus Marinimicrobia bacterium]|nr:D-alanine--D-alanine ligase [Candidatus Neomarinimicrobiota bacterium]